MEPFFNRAFPAWLDGQEKTPYIRAEFKTVLPAAGDSARVTVRIGHLRRLSAVRGRLLRSLRPRTGGKGTFSGGRHPALPLFACGRDSPDSGGVWVLRQLVLSAEPAFIRAGGGARRREARSVDGRALYRACGSLGRAKNPAIQFSAPDGGSVSVSDSLPAGWFLSAGALPFGAGSQTDG